MDNRGVDRILWVYIKFKFSSRTNNLKLDFGQGIGNYNWNISKNNYDLILKEFTSGFFA